MKIKNNTQFITIIAFIALATITYLFAPKDSLCISINKDKNLIRNINGSDILINSEKGVNFKTVYKPTTDTIEIPLKISLNKGQKLKALHIKLNYSTNASQVLLKVRDERQNEITYNIYDDYLIHEFIDQGWTYHSFQNDYTDIGILSNRDMDNTQTLNDIIDSIHNNTGTLYTINWTDYNYTPDITGIIQSNFEFPYFLRGFVMLEGYSFNDQLNIHLKKQDLNLYAGEDPLLITVYDLATKKIIYEYKVADDGIVGEIFPAKAIDWSEGKDIDITINGVKNKHFAIVFNTNFDVLIKHLRISEPLVYIKDNVYIFDPIKTRTPPPPPATKYSLKIYGNSLDVKTIHKQSLQLIGIDNPDKGINLTELDKNYSKILGIQKQEHELFVRKLDVILNVPDGYILPAENKYIHLYSQDEQIYKASEIIDKQNCKAIVGYFKIPTLHNKIWETDLSINTSYLDTFIPRIFIKIPDYTTKNYDFILYNIEITPTYEE